MPKKKFIDKKKAVTFHLVNRSLKDPLAVDETAPQKVLVPVNDKPSSKPNDKKVLSDKHKEEQQKYGIFFDDDYNYLQHLRDVNQLTTEWVENPQESKIKLPSSVFESNVEEKESFLNKSAPGLDVQLQTYDPDIIAALDEDFDFDDPDNVLEDNFIELANQDDGEDDGETETEDDFDDSDVGACSDNDVDGSEASFCKFENEETKSRFTEYSMSSNIIKRNNQLTLLDDKFENMYISYDDNEIGALDSEEIQGYLGTDSHDVLKTSKEYEKQRLCDLENATDLTKKILKRAECLSDEDNDDALEKMVVETPNDKNWDCESILSTYSNIYNHPKLISESKGPRNSQIEIDNKSGIPKNVLSWQNSNKLTLRNIAILKMYEEDGAKKPSKGANSVKSGVSVLNHRPKNETKEEKKERKRLIKTCRKERRVERKMNINSFKEEKSRQEKMLINQAKTSVERCIL